MDGLYSLQGTAKTLLFKGDIDWLSIYGQQLTTCLLPIPGFQHGLCAAQVHESPRKYLLTNKWLGPNDRPGNAGYSAAPYIYIACAH